MKYLLACCICCALFSGVQAWAIWCGTSECTSCGSHGWSKREECKYSSESACRSDIARIKQEMNISGAVFSCYEQGQSNSNSSTGNPVGDAVTGAITGNQQQFATGVGGMIGNAIVNSFRGNSKEASAPKAVPPTLTAEQKRQAMERAIRDEEARQRLLGSLKGMDAAPQLSLMGVGDAPNLQPISEDSTPKLLRDGTSESGAKGHRIVNCEEMKKTRDRLDKGLPQQRETIARTEQQLASAKEEGAKAWGELTKTAQEAVVKEAKEFAFETLRTTGKVRKRLEKLKLTRKIDDKTVRNLSVSLEALDKGAEGVKKLKQSGAAGAQYGVDHFDAELGHSTTSLWNEIKSANKLFVESGVAEELGENLSKGLGPLGPTGFRLLKAGIEGTAQAGQVSLSSWEREQAQAALQTMREQLHNVESRISELDQDIAENCSANSARH